MDVDLSVPDGAPPDVTARLLELRQELEEGDITAKGYRKHREQVIAKWLASQEHTDYAASVYSGAPSSRSRRRQSAGESIGSHPVPEMLQSLQSQGVGQSSSRLPLPEIAAISGPLQRPLPPRGIPESANTDPLNTGVRLTKFDNLPSILRHRGRTNADVAAFMVLDKKGKEHQSITWSKLASKSEKVGQMLRDQSGLFRGDRVILLYAEYEPIEFIIAMMGCFLAGLVAVPVSPHQPAELSKILSMTQCHLVLTTETQLKLFQKNHSEKFAQLKDVQFWKTTDWGSYAPPKRGADLPALQVPDLAYIDYAYSPTGDLRGVVMSHRTLLHQMQGLMAILRSRDVYTGKVRRGTDRLLCSLDIRRSTGLIMGVLLTVYSGNCTYILTKTAMAVPGLYAHVATRNRVSMLLSDYPALKQVCYNYQSAPQATRNFSKKQKIDLSTLRWCLIDAATVDAEFQMVLADRWLKPLGNAAARDIVAPMLTLTEHGGMVIAMRDFLAVPDGGDALDAGELYLDREALKRNKVQIKLGGGGPTNTSDTLAIVPFGFPLPDATVAVVDPETGILAGEMTVGELWIDSPSLSGGFWGLAEDTESTFHARCFDEKGALPLEFLRTGLLGFIEDGLVYVIGLTEDRLVYIPSPTSPVSSSGANNSTPSPIESSPSYSKSDYVYEYSPHLSSTIMHSVQGRIYDCCVFQMPLAGRLLSILVLETPDAVPPPAVTAMTATLAHAAATKQETTREQTLDLMCQRGIAVLEQVHQFPIYCAIATWPNATPRVLRAGRPDIAKILASHQVLHGRFSAAYVRFNAKSIADSLPRGQDPVGGIWSPAISHIRNETLGEADKQYSGVDMRTKVLDDRTQHDLTSFESLVHLFQWRVARQPDELAYQTLSSSTKSGTETSWRKLDQRVAATVQYLRDHLRAQAGDIAVLMYTHSEDFVVAVLACFFMGISVLPLSPLNTVRLDEDLQSLYRLIKRFRVTLLLGNHETWQLMDDKQVTHYLKHRRLVIPKIHNTAKVKVLATHTCKSYKMPPRALKTDFAALVWLYWSPDHELTASHISHQALLGMCKIQKETCQMTSRKPVIGCVRSVSGLGFLYTVCLGIYVGMSTLLVSPVDYANNPSSYFLTASRYKVKDGYATVQMLEHACRASKPRNYSLSELTNLIVPMNGRTNTSIVNDMRLAFAAVELETISVNLAYGTDTNPMITTRSYMLVDGIEIWLDPVALRQGYVSVVNPMNCSDALYLLDSGMVPINTQIAIVNPETRCLCRTGEFGEIWVVSDANQTAYFKRDGTTNDQIMSAVIADGDPEVKYMRTGDFGFLHTVVRGLDVEMQVLFVLGAIADTIEVNGLQHFVYDVEADIEKHDQVDSAVLFTANNMNVVVAETSSDKRYLPSLGTWIANSILEEHEFLPDVVAFIGKGQMPKSRLKEKQRKTLITKYVENKLTIAGQYGVNMR